MIQMSSQKTSNFKDVPRGAQTSIETRPTAVSWHTSISLKTAGDSKILFGMSHQMTPMYSGRGLGYHTLSSTCSANNTDLWTREPWPTVMGDPEVTPDFSFLGFCESLHSIYPLTKLRSSMESVLTPTTNFLRRLSVGTLCTVFQQLWDYHRQNMKLIMLRVCIEILVSQAV